MAAPRPRRRRASRSSHLLRLRPDNRLPTREPFLSMESKRFPTACVASPHYLASSAGLAVLASGGNALDAAIATNLTLGVVTPYLCGYGGDLVRQARRYAHEGFPLTAKAEHSLARARQRFADSPDWMALYGRTRAGELLHQPGLARTIDMLSTDGPDAYYRGQIGQAIADHVSSLGGLLSEEDLAEHRGEWIEPVSAGYRGVQVLELPPNTQGIAVLEALRIMEANGALPPDGPDRHHLLIEVMKLALAARGWSWARWAAMVRPRHICSSSPESSTTVWTCSGPSPRPDGCFRRKTGRSWPNRGSTPGGSPTFEPEATTSHSLQS